MGFWSKFKKAVKKVWRVVKAVVRVVARVVITLVNRLTLGLPDLLLGFIAWPPKRLRLHVFILWNVPPTGGGDELPPVAQVAQAAIDRTKKIYKDKFNVNVRPYSNTFIEILNEPVPTDVLDFTCGIGFRRTSCVLRATFSTGKAVRDRRQQLWQQGYFYSRS